MRTLGAAIAAGSLLVTSAFAATPLPVGKPAGVHRAQFEDQNAILIVTGVGLAALGIALAASAGGGGPTSSTTCTIVAGCTSGTSTTSTTSP